jgi:hypothetical protein
VGLICPPAIRDCEPQVPVWPPPRPAPADKPLPTFKRIAVVVAWTVDVPVKRPDGADYDAPHTASAVRASPRSQAWAWSVS